MGFEDVQSAHWSKLSDLIGERFGLSFPAERRDQLQRCIVALCKAFDFADVAACIERLVSAPLTEPLAQALAAELTVGETYFFREPAALAAFVDKIVPELIGVRSEGMQQLRILSAGCCTGEEAYSLAILLHQRWPELAGADVRILGVDLNASFLEQAKAGIYREWSFRATPKELKQRYFSRTRDGRYRVVPEIRRMVRFEQLNLADETYPSTGSGIYAMDVIFCRNVLMYFAPAQLRRAIGRLHAALTDGGWLIVSPSEASASLFAQFVHVYSAGAILFRRARSGAPCVPAPRVQRSPPTQSNSPKLRESSAPPQPPFRRAASSRPRVRARGRDVLAHAESLISRACYAEAAELLQSSDATRSSDKRGLELLVRALANLGSLDEAEVWCNRWIESDKLNASARYMRAVVLVELDRRAEARAALQHALYLEPGFELAHFTLGNLALRDGERELARRSFENALTLLRNRERDERLEDSGGMVVREMVELIGFVMQAEHMT